MKILKPLLLISYRIGLLAILGSIATTLNDARKDVKWMRHFGVEVLGVRGAVEVYTDAPLEVYTDAPLEVTNGKWPLEVFVVDFAKWARERRELRNQVQSEVSAGTPIN